MAKHKQSVIYCAYKIGRYPNAEICTADKSRLEIAVFPYNSNGFSFKASRKFAKMLARRINQCLEDTK